MAASYSHARYTTTYRHTLDLYPKTIRGHDTTPFYGSCLVVMENLLSQRLILDLESPIAL